MEYAFKMFAMSLNEVSIIIQNSAIQLQKELSKTDSAFNF